MDASLCSSGVEIERALAARVVGEMGYLGAVEEPGPPTTNEQIFVSYGRRDGAESARELCALLEDHGYRTWLDTREIPAGSVFPARIQEGIEASDLLVAVLTPWSVRRDSWCLDELAHARNTEVPILPVRFVDGIGPPLPIASLSYIDVFGDREGAFEEVLAQIEEIRRTRRSPVREFGADAPWWTRVERPDFDSDLARHRGRFVGRGWLFDLLRERIREPDARVVLLTGAAGIGKTAIAAQAPTRLNVRGVHFCSRSIDRSCRPESWLAGLVHQLALQFPAYGEQLESMPEPDWQDTRSLFRTVVADPLKRVESSIDVSEPLVFVVDGLDEAVAFEGHGMSLTIRDAVADFPPWLRVIVTCRPDQGLRDSFELPNIRVHEVAADSEPNLADVRAYVESRIRQLPEVSDDPGERVALVRWIVGAVEGNFLVASMTLGELAERGLDAFKGPDTEAMFPRTAKGLYTQMFQNRFDRDEYRGRLRPLLEALVAARSPLPRDLVCRTLEDRYDAEDGLAALSQFLEQVDGGLVLFHKSLADWLVGYAGAEHVVIPEHGHRKLAEICTAEYDKGVEQLSPYALRHLPAHLMLSGDWDRAIRVLDDARYRETKIERGHYDDLIADLEMAQRDQPPTLTADQRSALSALWTKVPDRGEGETEKPDQEPAADDAMRKLLALLGVPDASEAGKVQPKAGSGERPAADAKQLTALLERMAKARQGDARPSRADLIADNELLLSHMEVRGVTRDKLADAMVKRPGVPAPDLDDPVVLNHAIRAFFAQVLPGLDVEEILRSRRPARSPQERVEEAQQELKRRLANGDIEGARRIVEELADDPMLDGVRKAWLEQLDEAEKSLGISRDLEGVVERVKEAVEQGDFAGARAAVDQLPSGHREVRAFRRSVLKQIAEAEYGARINVRIEEAIERSKDLVGEGRIDEARAVIQALPDDPPALHELKGNLLGQLDKIQGTSGDGAQATPAAMTTSVRNPPQALPGVAGGNDEPRRSASCPNCGSPVGRTMASRIIGVFVGLTLLLAPVALLQHSRWWLVLVVPLALFGFAMVLAQVTNPVFCGKCGWSGRARRRGSTPEESRAAAQGGWVQNTELARAVADANLQGRAFLLRKVDVTGDSLLFAFTTASEVPEDRIKDAGLALRCVVGQTLSAAVHHTDGVSTEDELAYRVTLSGGVVLSAPKLRSGDRVTQYLQVVSGATGGLFLVTVKPTAVPSTPSDEHATAHAAVLELLRPFFEALVGSPVVLGR